MTGRRYIAENGTEITDELVDRWAEEAENGFPGAEVTPFEGVLLLSIFYSFLCFSML